MRKELPFKYLEEPKRIGGEAESDVFEFKPEKGKEKEYVFKETRGEFALGRYRGETLEEKAAEMKIVFGILKKHYGDKIAQTYFVIGNNKEGKPCIMKVQEKLKGDCPMDIRSDDPRFKRIKKEGNKITKGMSRVELEIKKHPRFKNYSAYEIQQLIFDVDSLWNMIADKEGNIKIIDW